MSYWDAAAATIAAAFADPEALLYTQGGVLLPPMRAIRSDREAPNFQSGGASLRTVAYEVPRLALPAKPSKADSFAHRGRRWRIQSAEYLAPVDAWELIVGDDGPAT